MNQEQAQLYAMMGILSEMSKQEPELVSEIQKEFDTLVDKYISDDARAALMMITGIFAMQEGMKQDGVKT